MSDLFFKDNQWTRPLVSGFSAGLNSAMWFACPKCGASIIDMTNDTTNRVRHQKWHDKMKKRRHDR